MRVGMSHRADMPRCGDSICSQSGGIDSFTSASLALHGILKLAERLCVGGADPGSWKRRAPRARR